jgi:hypothetical protein
MMPDAIRVLQAFVFDDPCTGLLDAIQNRPEAITITSPR